MTNDTYREALLPCPFCGGDAGLYDHFYKNDGIRCKNISCTASPSLFDYHTKEALISAWNTRPSPSTTICAAADDLIDKALANAAEILANFKGEGERTKLDEWQACYAMLFTQMNDLVRSSRAATLCAELVKAMEGKKDKDDTGNAMLKSYHAGIDKCIALTKSICGVKGE